MADRRAVASVPLRALALSSILFTIGCASHPASPSVPARSEEHVVLTYLGAAGWRIDEGIHVLLVDPFFSRARVDDGKAVLLPDQERIAHYSPAHTDAILVGHSHYDHLLDVPDIAKRTEAMVVGSESTLNVARAAGVPEQRLVRARGGERLQFGPFSVRAIRALHSVNGLPNETIPAGVRLPMAAAEYVEGGTLQYLVQVADHAILFIGTANFIEGELDGLRPDVAVIATRGREKVQDYACRLMRALGRPRLVLPNHFDAHWEPLGATQMNIDDADRADLAAFSHEIHACSPETSVVLPIHLQPRTL
ncbi:MAG TPA: MBL fold metallo-hydrolase [Polyangiaceae bacterium]|nr:MBL fold metallo-hydrolase [Polyangiaceae bacterium]